MTTNGYLIDQYIDLILEWKIDSIQITLDGTKEVYESGKRHVGVSDAFEHALNNIFLLSSCGMNVSIRMNVGRNNMEDLKRLSHLLITDPRWNDKIGIYFHPLMDYIKADERYLNASDYEMILSSLYQTLYSLGYYHSVKQFRIRSRTISCYGWDMVTFAIGPNGELYNCQHELGQPQFIIGDIQTGMRIVSRIVNEHSASLSPQCYTCKYLPVCQGGCFFAMRAGNTAAQCQSIKYEISIRMKLLLDYLTANHNR